MNRRQFLLAAWFAFAALAAGACAADTVLYEKASRYGDIIVTEDESGLRTLRFEKGGARQSVVKPGDPDYLELPYTRVALAGLALCAEPRRVLIVGLGGGTLAMFLHRHYPQAVIDVVDIDADVVQAARRFFGFREDERLRAHVADGREFIEKTALPYDAVFLDAFGANSVPPHLTTIEFLRAVRRAVTPGGIVIGNVWGRYANSLYDSMTRTYREAFAAVAVVDVRDSGNKIVLALPRRQPLDRAGLAALARRTSAAHHFPFDAGELIDYGYERSAGSAAEGRVLTDANPKQP